MTIEMESATGTATGASYTPAKTGEPQLAYAEPEPSSSIVIRGARVHNLRNLDVDIPHNALTVVTGVSGSGKSSLAFDTVYAEGQRRYVESLSAYARQFLERIEKPDADLIDGIAPAVAIRQKNTTRNPRSTVATATEIYDYLRLLYARAGRTYCAQCGALVRRDSVDEVAARMLAFEEGARFNVLFPLHAGAAPLKERLFELRKRGFNRLFQKGVVFEFSTPESLLDLDFNLPIYALVDRLAVAQDIRSRLVDAIETGYREAAEVIFEAASTEGAAPQQLRFAQTFECKQCRIRYEAPEPRLFSFNNPYGACPRCQGFGNTIDFDLDLVIPDKNKTLAEGAIDPWTKPKYRALYGELKKFAAGASIPLDVPWQELTAEQQHAIVGGGPRFWGIRGFFEHLEHKKYKVHVRVFLSRYRGYSSCSSCGGMRLRPEARQVRLHDRHGGRNICEVCAMNVEEARRFFDSLQLTREEGEIATGILEELRDRLRYLEEVGLEYLTLDRGAATLSGGEAQRIQLAAALGSRLVGTLYVLDEPSIGLHARDTHRLVKILKDLRDLGNTILVVEHDPQMMRDSDRIIDLGPGAGENGGHLVAEGTYEGIKRMPQSLTGRFLSGELHIPVPSRRRQPGRRYLRLLGARAHNLKHINVTIPLQMMVAITGVSGSGKSTLVHEVLHRALAAARNDGVGTPPRLALDQLIGAEFVDDVVVVDQSPIGRTPRSNPVTYIKAFDAIREVFASLLESRKRGYGPGHFSFNVPGGRCETCEGDGTVTVEMQFLADVELVCEECKGARYKPEVLEIRYRGKNIQEVLNLTVKEGLQFFASIPKLSGKLRVLDEVGLGYLRLGQSATTLSGGEAQRMKLAAHLKESPIGGRRQTGTEFPRLLYIFDEPTTGLHFDDVSKLLAALRKLIDAGGSVIVIEHNLDVIKAADWVIDLGPEGGQGGGEVVIAGTPEEVAAEPRSYTGRFLAEVLRK